MPTLDMTKMSPRGQVVIPGDIRAALGLVAGTRFVVAGEGDTVVLKRIGPPSRAEIDNLFKESRKFARRAGLKKSDIKKAIARSRAAR